MKAFIGVDVSKNTLDVAAVAANKIAFRGKFGNNIKGIANLITKAAQKLKAYELVFGCEATGIYHKLFAKTVYREGYDVAVINPRLVHHEFESMGRKTSTDRIDAHVIAYRLSREQDRLWEPCDADQELLRDLILRRDQILRTLKSEKSRLDRFPSGNRVRKSVERIIKMLEKELAGIEKEIKGTVESSAVLKEKTELARSVPGVGKLVAASFVAVVGDVGKFENAGQLTSFLGLCPRQKISGTSVNRSYLSRTGDGLLRRHLYMGAVATISKKNVYHDYFDSLVGRGKCKKQALAAVMRKMARAVYAILRDNKPFSLDRYGVNPIVEFST